MAGRGAWACYNLQERLMPHLRAETAKRLASRGLRQGRIAEHLGVSQAMVSKYLRAPPQVPGGFPAAGIQAAVDKAVEAVLADEAGGRVPAFCPLCPSMTSRELAEATHECMRGEELPDADDSRAVLDNLERARARIQKLPLARLAPEVNLNLAMALAGARDARGVASFPGRLVEVRGEIRPLGPPELGTSRHLSELLLRLRRDHPHVRAILCARDAPAVRAALRTAKLRHIVLPRRNGELILALGSKAVPDALIDPGDFGIEPITYLLGTDALDTVAKAERILAHLPPEKKP